MYPANLHDAGSLSEWLGIEAFLPLLGDHYRRSHSLGHSYRPWDVQGYPVKSKEFIYSPLLVEETPGVFYSAGFSPILSNIFMKTPSNIFSTTSQRHLKPLFPP